MIKTKRTVVVMGGLKGGTSSIAGALSILGVHMGDDLSGNGEYEDRAFMDQPVDNMREAIAKRNQEHVVWGWKFYKTCFFIKHIIDDLVNPCFIMVVRDPYAAALSMSKRLHLPAMVSYVRAMDHLAENFDFMMRVGVKLSCFPISYEYLIRFPEETIERMVSNLGLEVEPEALKAAIEFVQPGQYQRGKRRGKEASIANTKNTITTEN